MSRQRPANQLRPTKIKRFATAAPGGVIIEQGKTRILCTASLSPELPRWLQGKDDAAPSKGWITAEYAMLPGSTPDRKRRGSDSRGTEIQRLIARVLRAAVDLKKMPGVMIVCDCDVLFADGGTRTASITGAFVALAQAIAHAQKQGLIKQNPIKGPIAAISAGIVDGRPHIDLDYDLDARADVDLNVAMNHRGQFVEVQGTAELNPFSKSELDQLLTMAAKAIRSLIRIQRKVLP